MKINLMIRFVLLFCVVALARPSHGHPQSAWKTFKSTDENFIVSMPAEPEQEWTKGNSPLGNGHHIYNLDQQNLSYTVSYSELDAAPKDQKDIKRIFDISRDMVLAVRQGGLKGDKEIALDGFPGREVRIEVGKELVILRIYVVKNRIYQLMTSQPKTKSENPDILKFYDSFRLIRKPE